MLMSVTRLPAWNVTAIEVALDLESTVFANAAIPGRSGAPSPRICLVTGFAFTTQLKRVVGAIGRAIPPRLPLHVRIARSKTRDGRSTPEGGFSIQPMLALIRLQSRLAKAIEPGLADDADSFLPGAMESVDESTARFVHDFIFSKALPTFEPYDALADFVGTPLVSSGITVYRLGNRAEPQTILGHWTYVRSTRSSVHLPSGP
jgi:hypothetical protein